MASKCPSCGEESVVRIVYGLVEDPRALRQELREDVILGGCCVSDHDPQWGCRACDARFYGDDRPGRSDQQGR